MFELEPRKGYVRASLKRDDAKHTNFLTFSPQQAREAGMALLRAAQDADGEVLRLSSGLSRVDVMA
jgi:hypothetical protein